MSNDRAARLAAMTAAPLFRGLSEDDLDALLGIARSRKLEKGETVFREGQEAEAFFLVVTGQVKLIKLSPAGKEQILHIHGPGGSFAEATLAEGSRYPASAVATEAGAVLVFPRRGFQQLLAKRPGIATNVIARLSQRLREMTRLVEDLSLREAPGRLARYLLELAGEEPPSGAEVRLPVKKGELAALLGTRGETLSRVFRKLTDVGAIEVKGANVTLVSPEILEDVSEGEFPGL
jgi:CRP/FNR family transcriptional regulator